LRSERARKRGGGRERELRSFSEKFFVGGSMGSQIVVLLLQWRERERERVWGRMLGKR